MLIGITPNAIGADCINPVLFNPASLFTGGLKGVWYDPSDLNSMFQDAAGTIPVTADNDPIGLIKDKSGNNAHASQATAAKRPKYRTGAGRPYIEFDGTQTFFSTSAINATAYSVMSAVIGAYKADGTVRQSFEFSPDSPTNNGSFSHPPGSGGANNWGIGLKGTLAIISTSAVVGVPPTTTVNTCLYALGAASDQARLRVNGVQVATTGAGNTGAGPFGNHSLYIGSRAGTSLFFLGRIYQLIIVSKTLAGAELTNAEKHVANKTGVTL